MRRWSPREAPGYMFWLATGIVLLANTSIYLTVIPHYSWGMFEYEGWLIIEGVPLYSKIAEINAPLLQLLYAATFTVVPPGITASYGLTLAVLTAAGLAVAWAARELGGVVSGLLALAAWCAWSTLFAANLLWPNLLAIPLTLGAAGALWRAGQRSNGIPLLYLSGALTGLVMVTKQSLLLVPAVLAVLVVVQGRGLEQHLWKRLGGYLLGVLSATSAVLVPLAAAAGPDAVAGELLWSATRSGWSPRWNELGTGVLAVGILLMIAAVPTLYKETKGMLRGRFGLSAMLILLLPALGADIARNLRGSIALPAIALLCILAATSVADGDVRAWRTRVQVFVVGCLVLGMTVSLTYVIATRPYDAYGQRLQSWYEAGRWVAEHTPNTSRLFVFGAPATYFGALRQPVTRYINLEPSTRAIEGQEERIIRDLASAKDEVVVYYRSPHVSTDKISVQPRWTYYLRLEKYLLMNYCVASQLRDGIWFMREQEGEAGSAELRMCDQ